VFTSIDLFALARRRRALGAAFPFCLWGHKYALLFLQQLPVKYHLGPPHACKCRSSALLKPSACIGANTVNDDASAS
jgi:hypothetical protein